MGMNEQIYKDVETALLARISQLQAHRLVLLDSLDKTLLAFSYPDPPPKSMQDVSDAANHLKRIRKEMDE